MTRRKSSSIPRYYIFEKDKSILFPTRNGCWNESKRYFTQTDCICIYIYIYVSEIFHDEKRRDQVRPRYEEILKENEVSTLPCLNGICPSSDQNHPRGTGDGPKGHPYNEKRSNYYINSTGCSSTSIIHYCEKFSTGRQTRQQFAPTRLCSSFHATRHTATKLSPRHGRPADNSLQLACQPRYNNTVRSLFGVIKPRPITEDTWPTVRSITCNGIVAKFIRTIDARWRPRSKKKSPNDLNFPILLFIYYGIL